MGNKRDMYLDFKRNHSGRKRNRPNENVKKVVSSLLVVVLAVSIGYGTYYFSKDLLLKQKKDLTTEVGLNDQELIATTGDNNVDIPNDTIVENNNNGNTSVEVTESGTSENDITENLDDETVEVISNTEDPIEDVEEAFMPDFIDTRTPVKVKGIYVTGPRAGTDMYMSQLIDLVETTELNAMVIDIKNDSGEITYKMDLPLVQEMKAGVNYIPNLEELIAELKAKDIYLIARIVAFKDPMLAEYKTEYSLKKADGTVFRDKEGLSWVNPYQKEVWDYLIDVSKKAVELGFDEIQFDYIRFSTDSGMKDVVYGDEAGEVTKSEIIAEFTKYACEQLKPLGVYVSADVYGTIIDNKTDAEIVGQDYVEMSKYLDYICPMIYPSHYADGSYGIAYPDLEPYNLISSALNRSVTKLSEIDENSNKAIVRSWLQDFTAKWINNYTSYGPEEIKAQIQAVYDTGYEEWILWNGSTNYTKEGLLPN